MSGVLVAVFRALGGAAYFFKSHSVSFFAAVPNRRSW
jgi:hypothetical protein